MTQNKITPEYFVRIPSDINGNPRYACHFLNLNTEREKDSNRGNITALYDMALERSRKVGGRKYNNKRYGRGIVFSTYSLVDLCKRINAILESDESRVKVSFRKFENGEIIAFFDAESIPANPACVMSYLHTGQHGEATRDLQDDLKRASKKEYQALKAELELIGYVLEVVNRV